MRSRQQCPGDAPIVEHDAADEDVISDRCPLIISIDHDRNRHIPSIIAECGADEIRSLSSTSNPHGLEGKNSQNRAGDSSETEDGGSIIKRIEAGDEKLATCWICGGAANLDAVVELEGDAGG